MLILTDCIRLDQEQIAEQCDLIHAGHWNALASAHRTVFTNSVFQK